MSGVSPETPEEKAESRAIRRRWITIGEVVAVAGVVIAGLSLYGNWSERRQTATERQIEKAVEARKASTVTFKASAEDNGDRLVLADAAHDDIASIDVSVPRVLGVPTQTAILEPRIDSGWFAKPLLAATDGGPDAIEGRLPVLIATTITDGEHRTVDRAIYDVVFRTEGRTFGGRHLSLAGVILRERVKGDASARLDSLWATEARRLAALKQ